MNKKLDQEKPVSDNAEKSAESVSYLTAFKESLKSDKNENTDNIYQEEIVLDEHVEVDGLLRYFIHHRKDDKPKPYNLRWLSVAAIELELDAAFYGEDTTSRLLHHVLDTETQGAKLFCRILSGPQEGSARLCAPLLSWGGTQSPEIENLKTRLAATQHSFETEIYKKFFTAYPVPSHLLQKDDEKTVILIQSNPEKLLQEPEVQDALSRWTYAASFYPATDIRCKATRYIKESTNAGVGRPKKTPSHLLRWRNSYQVLASLVQEGDEELVDLIRFDPEALLKSFQAQDAFSRWTYASLFCSDTGIQTQAQGYINTIILRRRARPKKANPSLPQLLMAYDNLCDYCKCVLYITENLENVKKKTNKEDVGRIYKAGDKTIYKCEDIEKYFPEVRLLKVENRGLDIAQALNLMLKKPVPSIAAFEYISARYGLSISSVERYISNAKELISQTERELVRSNPLQIDE